MASWGPLPRNIIVNELAVAHRAEAWEMAAVDDGHRQRAEALHGFDIGWHVGVIGIVDQRPGEVFTALVGLDDLPLARASLREDLLRRSRRWRQRLDSESTRWRQQWQQASDRIEERLEGWLEEPPWDGPALDRDPLEVRRSGDVDADVWPDGPDRAEATDRELLRRRSPGAPPASRHSGGSDADLDGPEPAPADREGDLPSDSWQGEEIRDGRAAGVAPGRRPLGARPRQRPSPPPAPSSGDDDPWV